VNGEPAVQSYLQDTSTALLALADPDALSPRMRDAILAGPNVLSVVSFWEVMLKSMKGTLDVGDPRAWWFEALEQLAATPLVLRPPHIAGVFGLPPIHRDPFDRVLIAQATAEGLALVTVDGEIARYASKSLRVVR
jgi:PIN domain nuclease of toxin-antitoxin system